MKLWLTILLTLPLLISCQSSPIRDFESVNEGMDKQSVLNIMGSPSWTLRWRGLDRWNYTFFENDQWTQKEVHFQNGKTVYKGEPPTPLVSAEEQDRINLQANLELAAKEKQDLETNRQQILVIDKSMQPETSNSEIRYVPRFVPLE